MLKKKFRYNEDGSIKDIILIEETNDYTAEYELNGNLIQKTPKKNVKPELQKDEQGNVTGINLVEETEDSHTEFDTKGNVVSKTFKNSVNPSILSQEIRAGLNRSKFFQNEVQLDGKTLTPIQQLDILGIGSYELKPDNKNNDLIDQQIKAGNNRLRFFEYDTQNDHISLTVPQKHDILGYIPPNLDISVFGHPLPVQQQIFFRNYFEKNPAQEKTYKDKIKEITDNLDNNLKLGLSQLGDKRFTKLYPEVEKNFLAGGLNIITGMLDVAFTPLSIADVTAKEYLGAPGRMGSFAFGLPGAAIENLVDGYWKLTDEIGLDRGDPDTHNAIDKAAKLMLILKAYDHLNKIGLPKETSVNLQTELFKLKPEEKTPEIISGIINKNITEGLKLTEIKEAGSSLDIDTKLVLKTAKDESQPLNTSTYNKLKIDNALDESSALNLLNDNGIKLDPKLSVDILKNEKFSENYIDSLNKDEITNPEFIKGKINEVKTGTPQLDINSPLNDLTNKLKYTSYDEFINKLEPENFRQIDDYIQNKKPEDFPSYKDYLDRDVYTYLEKNKEFIDMKKSGKANTFDDIKTELKAELPPKEFKEANKIFNSRAMDEVIQKADERLLNNEIDITQSISLEPETTPGETKGIKQIFHDSYQMLFDRFHSLSVLSSSLVKDNIKLKPEENPYILSRLYPSVLDKINSWIYDKQTKHVEGKEVILGPGLNTILTQDKLTNLFKGRETIVKKLSPKINISPQDMLSVYMTNRAVIERTIQGQKHTIGLKQAGETIHLVDKYFPEIRDIYETEIKKFNNNLKDVAIDYFGEDGIKVLDIYRSDYASLERTFNHYEQTGKFEDPGLEKGKNPSPDDKSFSVPVKKFTDNYTPVKKSKGNENLIYKNSLENLVKNTFLMLDRIERNKITKSVVKAMEQSNEYKPQLNEINPPRKIKTETDLFGKSEEIPETEFYKQNIKQAEKFNAYKKNTIQEPALPAEVINNLTLNLFEEKTPNPASTLEIYKKARKETLDFNNNLKFERQKEVQASIDNVNQRIGRLIEQYKDDNLKQNDIPGLQELKDERADYYSERNAVNSWHPDSSEIDTKLHQTFDYIKKQKDDLVDIEEIRNKLHESEEYNRGRLQAGFKIPNVITFFDNGVKRAVQIPESIYRSLDGLNDSYTNKVIRILTIPTKLLQKGSTLTPEFGIANVFRDAFTTMINHGGLPFEPYFRGLFHILSRDGLFEKWIRNQGRGSTYFTVDRKSMQRVLQEFETVEYKTALDIWKNRTSFISSVKKLFEKGNNLQNVLFEYPTRLGIFDRSLKKSGMEMTAALESREGTVDFNRKGYYENSKETLAVAYNIFTNLIPFFNPRIQGFDRILRTIVQNPKAALIRTLPITLLPFYFNYINKLDPEYIDRPQWEKDTYWHIPRGFSKPIINYIIPFTKNSLETISKINPFIDQKDINNLNQFLKLSDNEFIKIPKGDTGYLFSTLPEKILSGEDVFDIVAEGGKILAPWGDPEQGSLIPVPLKPFIENYMTNLKSFSDEPISKLYKENGIRPEDDYTYNTYTIFKLLGTALNSKTFSPARLQNIYENWTGQGGRLLMEISESILFNSIGKSKIYELGNIPIVRRFITNSDTYTKTESKFYSLYNDAKEVRDTYHNMLKNSKYKEAEEWLNLKDNRIKYESYYDLNEINKKLFELRDDKRDIGSKDDTYINKLKEKININNLIKAVIENDRHLSETDRQYVVFKDELKSITGITLKPSKNEQIYGYFNEQEFSEKLNKMKTPGNDDFNKKIDYFSNKILKLKTSKEQFNDQTTKKRKLTLKEGKLVYE